MISFRRSHRRKPSLLLAFWRSNRCRFVKFSSWCIRLWKKPLNQILFQILFHKRWYGCCHLQNFRFEAHDWYMLLKRLFNYFTFLDWINSLTSCREAFVTCLAVWSLNWKRLASNEVLTLWSVRWWNRSAGGNLLDSNLCVTRCDEHVNLGLGHSRPVCNSCHSIRSTGLFFRMVQFFVLFSTLLFTTKPFQTREDCPQRYMGMCQEIPESPKAAINSFTQTMKFPSQHLTKIHPSGRMMASAVLSGIKLGKETHLTPDLKRFLCGYSWRRAGLAAMLFTHSECRSCAQLMNRSSITFSCLILFIAFITVFVFFPL